MRLLALILALTACATDKVMHAGGSAAMTLSAQYVAQEKLGLDRWPALGLSVGAALAIGAGKELADARTGGDASRADMLANLSGVSAAAIVVAW